MNDHPLRPTRRGFLSTGAIAVAAAAAGMNNAQAHGAEPGAEPAGQSPATNAPGTPAASVKSASPEQTFLEPARSVPLTDSCDVIVCGAGPAGISAAIAAARCGASTRLIEARGCLGGVWTAGLLSWILDWKNKSGFMAELRQRLLDANAATIYGGDLGYAPEKMKLILEQLCVESGVRVQLHTRVSAAYCEQGRLTTIVTDSKSGREAFRAKAFIDATGDGDLAAQAGCTFTVGRQGSRQTQPMSMIAMLVGLDPKAVARFIRGLAEPLGEMRPKMRLFEEMQRAGVTPSYAQPTLFYIRDGLFCMMANHEYGVSAFSAADITAATLRSRAEVHRLIDALHSLGDPWANVQIVATNEHIGVREGRRIKGLYEVTIDDLRQNKEHEDAVCRVTFPIDVHATDPNKEKGIERADFRVKYYDIPYRALVAKDVTGLLTAGRCISGDFIAHSSYRVTGNAVPMGETAGVAAALAAQSNRLPSELPWAEILARREQLRTQAPVQSKSD